MISLLKKIVVATTTLCALTLAPLAHAGLVTFDIKWANQSGMTTATAELTLNSDLISTSAKLPIQIDANKLYSLKVTVAGAQYGNGVYGLNDFRSIAFYSTGKLNFNQELIGQHFYVGDGPFEQEMVFGDASGNSGAFDLFALNSKAPDTVRPFAVITDRSFENPDFLVVSSILARDTVTAVPEPETYAMLLAGLGLLGWRARRRA